MNGGSISSLGTLKGARDKGTVPAMANMREKGFHLIGDAR